MSELPLEQLTISYIHQAYEAQKTNPSELIFFLREKILAAPDYNAWIEVLDVEQLNGYLSALEGKSASELPLFGIPFAIKDNIDLAKTPTTASCKDFAYTPEKSAYVVEQLVNAGAIPMGKTNLDQFATGLVGTRSPYGQGKNVFNQDYVSGGSSAGSAIATSLGQVCFALGTDTAGSGRVPAVFNNLIGHKPTKGALSCSGVVPACKTLDCVSIFSLTAQDAATIFDVAASFDEKDSMARENRFDNRARYFNGQTSKHFTFGVPDQLEFFGNEECETIFNQSIRYLENLGGQAVPITFAPFLEAAKLLYEGPWVAERFIATQGVERDAMLPEIKTIIGNGNNGTAAEAFKAQYRLAELKRICDSELNKVDIAIAPTTPTVFTRAEIDADPIKNNAILGTYTNFMNLLDYTATAVPTGILKSGVHWGITLFHQAFTDIFLLNTAQALQQTVGFSYGAKNTAPHTRHSTHDIKLVEKQKGRKQKGEKQNNTAPSQQTATTDIVVCGAHLSGQPLNWQLTERGGTLKECTQSTAQYQLYALPDGKRPAMVRVGDSDGHAIDVEVWSVPTETLGSFITQIPAPLGIGKVELSSGEWVSGFICDGYGLDGAQEISEYGSWRNWLSSRSS